MPQVERNPNPLTRGNRSLIPQLFSLLLVILVVYYCLLYPIYYVIVLLFGLVDLVLYYSMYGIHHVVNQFLFSVEWDFLQFVLVFGLCKSNNFISVPQFPVNQTLNFIELTFTFIIFSITLSNASRNSFALTPEDKGLVLLVYQ